MRGQVWSIDFAVSVIIFLVVLIPLLLVWNQMNEEKAEATVLSDLQTRVLYVSDQLVRSPGVPEGWGPSDVQVVGLADDENVLNETKVAYFLSMDYDYLKNTLTRGYDFYFAMADINGTALYTKGSLHGTNTTMPVERYAQYRGRIVKLKFALIYIF